ncbi:MAG: sulfotransferase family protein [Pseudomonadota bacterium]
MTRRIALWSGPRNVSTALMYSWAQRPDTTVVDEPLYGHYLMVSGADHPGRDEVIADMDCDGPRVVQRLATGPVDTAVLFMKHMAHHLVGLDASVVDAFDNVLLIRDPYDMLPSLTIQIPHATLADTGLARQSALFESLTLRGRQPAVIDAQVLLADPAGVLGALCDTLGLAFDPAMLRWPAGPRPEDGIWAPHWYHAVHKSTGFGPYTAKTDFPTHLEPLLEACRPHYNLLRPHVISARDPAPEVP